MTIRLTEAQTGKWGVADWRAGFVAALQQTVSDTVMTVRIEDSAGTALATYIRKWTLES